MSDSEEDFVFYGTALETVDDLPLRKRKQAQEAGLARTQPLWKQEVFDENGRQRFHGAFTGGFSAGFFNTVGTKEGWVPKTFTSSRKDRAEVSKQTAYDFMDEDEKAELDSKQLGTSSEFDTFGLTAADAARQEATQELSKRPSVIPEFLPDDIIVPVAESVGIKLLLKMGWRHGRAIGPEHVAGSSEAKREGRKAMLTLAQMGKAGITTQKVYGAERDPELQHNSEKSIEEEDDEIIVPSSTPVYVIHPKNDTYGLGFDPYKNAPEFRERKQPEVDRKHTSTEARRHALSKPSLFRPNAGRMGSGFGIGALEELGEEDEDIYAAGASIDLTSFEEEDNDTTYKEPKRKKLSHPVDGSLPGFVPALFSECKAEWFTPPTISPGFIPVHKFDTPLQQTSSLVTEPEEGPPPEDPYVRKVIEGLAVFVARSGEKFEEILRDKNTGNPVYLFLFGGLGHEYYRRKLWEEQRKLAEEGKGQVFSQELGVKKPLDSQKRGNILGETPLVRIALSPAPSISSKGREPPQSAPPFSFVKSEDIRVSLNSQPFKDNPAKQKRFEQFLKDKYEGGLRKSTVGESSRTELERAQETLQFEAAIHALEQNKVGESAFSHDPRQKSSELADLMGSRFTSGMTEKVETKVEKKPEALAVIYPKREEQAWRPAPVLCKRFNLPDPYAGKPAPVRKARTTIESFMPIAAAVIANNPVPEVTRHSISDALSSETQDELRGVEEPLEAFVEKPVDLYKAIFSDDEDDDDGDDDVLNGVNSMKEEGRSAEAAGAALNRLEAGDFLTTLGKELGLKVPLPPSNISKEDKGAPEHHLYIITDSKKEAASDNLLPKMDEFWRSSYEKTQEAMIESGIACTSSDRGTHETRKHSSHPQRGDISILEKCSTDSDSDSIKYKKGRKDSQRRKEAKDSRRHKHRSRGKTHKESKEIKKSDGKERHKHRHHHHRNRDHHRKKRHRSESSSSTSSST